MYYIVESEKSFEQTTNDLKQAVSDGGFGLLHIHDLGNILRSKGMKFNENCQVFEVCNPEQAAKVLAIDMQLNMALPCRISVYTEQGKTKLGLIKPERMLSALSDDDQLQEIAKEVERANIKMIEQAK